MDKITVESKENLVNNYAIHTVTALTKEYALKNVYLSLRNMELLKYGVNIDKSITKVMMNLAEIDYS